MWDIIYRNDSYSIKKTFTCPRCLSDFTDEYGTEVKTTYIKDATNIKAPMIMRYEYKCPICGVYVDRKETKQ